MKYFIYLILISLFVSSCSHSDSIIDNDDDKEPQLPQETVDIKLNIKQKTGNIFELLEFSLYSEKEFTISDAKSIYDSLVWTVSDIGRFHIFKENFFAFSWSQNFFLPSQYTSVLLGYKDNKIIKADTAFITILDNKDFLGYNWKEVTTSADQSTGYTDVFSDKYSLATYQSVKENTPSITLFLYNKGKEEEKVFAQRSEKILSDYITSLYSEPTYTEKQSELLTTEYNKLSNDKTIDAKPISIWITSTSKILLYSYSEEYGRYNEYRIYAEPNRN